MSETALPKDIKLKCALDIARRQAERAEDRRWAATQRAEKQR